MAVVETKLMWMGKDGKIHYIDNRHIERVEDIAVKFMVCGAILTVCRGSAPLQAAEAVKAVGSEAVETMASGNELMTGLQPLIKLIGDLAEPVTYGYMVKAGLQMTQGKEEMAKKTFTNAGTGFLSIKFVPQVIRFLGKLKLFA